MKENNFITLKNENTVVRLNCSNVVAVKVESGICEFICNSGKNFSKAISLKKAVALFPNCLVQIDRNTAINHNLIQEVNTKTRIITLPNNMQFRASHRNIGKIMQTLSLMLATLVA